MQAAGIPVAQIFPGTTREFFGMAAVRKAAQAFAAQRLRSTLGSGGTPIAALR